MFKFIRLTIIGFYKIIVFPVASIIMLLDSSDFVEFKKLQKIYWEFDFI